MDARVKVTGVTCSMCSNSVQKALSSLAFVDNIDVDLENAVFKLTFKKDAPVDVDAIRRKIEGAGFSVGELVADFNFEKVEIENDFHYSFQNNIYHFVNVKNQQLDKVVTIRFVDKGLTSTKEYKRYSALTSLKCIKTGKPESCCHSHGKGETRIYHITI